MAITKSEIQVQWSSADSKSVAAGGTESSDLISVNQNAVAGLLVVKADNEGTPAAGDTIDVYILENAGDPDGSGSDEFSTPGHARFIGELDTNVEDPAILARDIPMSAKSLKLYVESNASSNSITVSACIYEQRAA